MRKGSDLSRPTRRSASSVVFKCCHGPLLCEFIRDVDASLALAKYRCRGSDQFGCTSFVTQECYMLNHRCGQGECRCKCLECKEDPNYLSKLLRTVSNPVEKIQSQNLESSKAERDEAATPSQVGADNADGSIILNRDENVELSVTPAIESTGTDIGPQAHQGFETLGSGDSEQRMEPLKTTDECEGTVQDLVAEKDSEALPLSTTPIEKYVSEGVIGQQEVLITNVAGRNDAASKGEGITDPLNDQNAKDVQVPTDQVVGPSESRDQSEHGNSRINICDDNQNDVTTESNEATRNESPHKCQQNDEVEVNTNLPNLTCTQNLENFVFMNEYSCTTYACDTLNNDEYILDQVVKSYNCCEYLFLSIRQGVHPAHRYKVNVCNTAVAIYKLMFGDLIALIWDDTKSSRVAEVIHISNLEDMYEKGTVLNSLSLNLQHHEGSENSVRLVVNPSLTANETTTEEALNLSYSNLHGMGVEPEISRTVYVLGDSTNDQSVHHNDKDHDDDEPHDDGNYFDGGDDVSEGEEDEELAFNRPSPRVHQMESDTVESSVIPNEVAINYDYFPQIVARLIDDGTIQIVKSPTIKPIPPNTFTIPDEIAVRDKKYFEEFSVLYNVNFDVKCVEVKVGGRMREFYSFHYPDGNSYPKERKGRLEFVEKMELQLLYRYDIKSAVSFSYMTKKKDIFLRFLFTYCYLACDIKSTKYTPKRFILVSILTTLCVNPFNVYIVWDTLLTSVVEWHGEHLIRYFWSDPDTEVDYHFLREKLDLWFARRRFYYDKTRSIPRDYHSPGNMDSSFDVKPEVAEKKLTEWKLSFGLRRPSNCEVLPKRQSKPTPFYVSTAVTLAPPSIVEEKGKNLKGRKKRNVVRTPADDSSQKKARIESVRKRKEGKTEIENRILKRTRSMQDVLDPFLTDAPPIVDLVMESDTLSSKRVEKNDGSGGDKVTHTLLQNIDASIRAQGQATITPQFIFPESMNASHSRSPIIEDPVNIKAQLSLEYALNQNNKYHDMSLKSFVFAMRSIALFTFFITGCAFLTVLYYIHVHGSRNNLI